MATPRPWLLLLTAHPTQLNHQGDQGRIISVSRKLGREVLNDGAINKGTAFPESERERMHIRGLLPPAVSSLELQVGRQTPFRVW